MPIWSPSRPRKFPPIFLRPRPGARSRPNGQRAQYFRTTEADVTWDQYQKVVDEHETQKGKVYFRRAGNEIQMAADITEPYDVKIQLFQSPG